MCVFFFLKKKKIKEYIGEELISVIKFLYYRIKNREIHEDGLRALPIIELYQLFQHFVLEKIETKIERLATNFFFDKKIVK